MSETNRNNGDDDVEAELRDRIEMMEGLMKEKEDLRKQKNDMKENDVEAQLRARIVQLEKEKEDIMQEKDDMKEKDYMMKEKDRMIEGLQRGDTNVLSERDREANEVVKTIRTDLVNQQQIILAIFDFVLEVVNEATDIALGVQQYLAYQKSGSRFD